MSAGVVLDRVSKRFGTESVLADVSLEIRDGEFLTLLGPSGCGKSTLLRIIAGLEAQDAGSVFIAGRRADRLRAKERDIAMVFQTYALYPHLTVAENMALPLKMRRMCLAQRLPGIGRLWPGRKAVARSIRDDVAATARALEIAHLMHRKPGQLSGGQRQRVAVGRAVVREPSVFLMDEPLSNLDAKLRVVMRAEIKQLHQRLGATILYVTHDQSEAMTLSDRVAVMHRGTLAQVGTPQAIYADPENLRVAEFVGSPMINTLSAIVASPSGVVLDGVALPLRTGLPAGGAVTLGLRPEAVSLAPAPGAGLLNGTVRLLEHMGAELLVHVALDGGETLTAKLDVARAGLVAVGRAVAIRPHLDQVLVFAADGRRLRCADHGGAVPASRGARA